jgi:hypothetical protein
MKFRRIKPITQVESATPADILDGLDTLEGRSGQGVIITPPGDGPDQLLNWALKEVNDARESLDEEQKHHCVDAVLHARRGLGCLVDWYLERDLATLCKDAPTGAKQKVTFLIRRGLIDELTSRVWERAIQKRDHAEHRYVSPVLHVAEDVVELLRRTVPAIRTQSPPEHGPWIFGGFQYRVQSSKKGCHAEFYGWSEPFVVFSRFSPRPWVGLVLPENQKNAVIRRALLKDTTTEELLALLFLAGRKFGVPSSYSDANSRRLLAAKANLL